MTVHGLFAVDFYHNGSICGNRIVRILGMMGITLIWLAPYNPKGNPIGVYTCYCLEITEAHSRARAFVSAAVCNKIQAESLSPRVPLRNRPVHSLAYKGAHDRSYLMKAQTVQHGTRNSLPTIVSSADNLPSMQ